MVPSRCRLLLLASTVVVCFNLVSEQVLEIDDPPREARPTMATLRSQPSAELFQGRYKLRMAGSANAAEGSLRMTIGSRETSAVGVHVSSIALTLVGAGASLAGSTRDVDFTLRGVELSGARRLTASGVSDPLALGAHGSLRPESCRLDAVLQPRGGGGAEAQGSSASGGLGGAGAGDEERPGRHAEGFDGDLASPGCGFELQLAAESVDMEAMARKVSHYSLWVNLLTLVQIVCFTSQIRHTDDMPSVTKLSMICIAVQALMDGYDSFLHLSLTASSHYMFNSFAIISVLKFILFALLEVRYVLTIWRHRNREVFNQGWDAVRRELSKVYAYFYGALIGGLLIIFNSLDHLDVIALALQAYWVPQILHDVRQGSKSAFTPHFLIGISVTRFLTLFYLWGCPAGLFTSDLFPRLPNAPNLRLCAAAFAIQCLQVAIMASQRMLGPRWFVPWICLGNTYNYRRVFQVPEGSECVICMGDLSTEDRLRCAITPCNHRFHLSCLETWMDVKMECPTCRAALPPVV